LLAILRERRLAAGVCAAFTVLAVLAWGLRGPDQYRAEARLAIERGRLEVPFAANPAFEGEDLVLVYTQRDLLLSSAVLSDALSTGALRGSLANELAEDPVAALRRRIGVVVSRDSRVLTIQLTDEDPRRAERGLTAVIDAFLADQARRATERSRQSVEFLARQVEDAGAALDRARSEEEQFRLANKLFQDDAERSFATQRLTTLQGKLVVMREQIAALDTLLSNFTAAGDDIRALTAIEAVSRNPVVLEVQKQLIELENRQATLSGRYLDKHPKMVELNGQVESKRRQLVEAAGQVVRGLRSEREKLGAQLNELGQHIAREEAELDRYQQALVKLAGFTERTKSRENLHQQLLKRLGEETVASRLDRSEAVLADPPRAAPRPVSWSFTSLMPVALLVGLVGGVLGGLATHALDPRIRGPAGLARAASGPVLARLAVSTAAPPEDPTHPDLAPARRLRDGLLVRKPSGPSCVWLLVGAEPDSGAASAACQLAAALAAAGSRTLLVDANLHAPDQARRLGVSVERGFDLLLAGEPDIAPVPTGRRNLDLMAAEQPLANAAELLHSHCLREWLDHAREHYEHIVFDVPALSVGSDALIPASASDVILLVAAEGDRSATITSAVEALRPLAARIAGAVLTVPGRA
jgi:uncharacterized protein involved in exopolysaccharide biosynthesis/Mrp family chromosome partitioning ATPase